MIAKVVLRKYSLQQEAFSYAVPENLQESLKSGMLISVPFRGGTEKAIVLEVLGEHPEPSFKPVLSILNYTPVLLAFQIKLGIWIANHYMCPLAKAIAPFLPKYIWEDKQEDWVEREIFLEIKDKTQAKGTKEKQVAAMLERRKQTTFAALRANTPNINLTYLRKLEQKEILTIRRGDIIPPYFKQYELKDISILGEKGLKELTPDQEQVFRNIQNSSDVSLLHGITGSGKTEIYLHLAYENFRQQKQTLILIPEIALTPQLIAYFYRVFGQRISVLHSHLSDGERFTEWVRIKQKESFIIIGSRSALFSPFQDIGTIILDEEHEWTYKNDQNPRYHAREVAIKMTEYTNAHVLLGSATPDIESYFRAKQGQYHLLKLQKKITTTT